tara:strand:+ start:130 stop:405 length:276 start_codon:yes stop_codon:yes gene_type:complete
MEDKIDLILYKLKDLKKEIDEIKAIVNAHRVEHGFAKMQDGGVNAQFGGQQQQSGPPGMMGGGGMPGMGGGYQRPGMGAPPQQDPSRPPGM